MSQAPRDPRRTPTDHGLAIPGRRCSQPAELGESLRWLMDQPATPRLLEVIIDTMVNVWPKVAFGRPISRMEPCAKPLEMEST